LAVAIGIALAGLGASAMAGVTDQDIVNDAAIPGDAVSWGIGPQGQRYSPMKTINESTTIHSLFDRRLIIPNPSAVPALPGPVWACHPGMLISRPPDSVSSPAICFQFADMRR